MFGILALSALIEKRVIGCFQNCHQVSESIAALQQKKGQAPGLER
jgi:hypothetical protein